MPNTFLYDQENRLFRTGPCRADVNGDGQVNSGDQGIIAAHFGNQGATAYDLNVDLNADLKVNSGEGGIAAAETNKNCKGPSGNGRSWYDGDGLRISQRTFTTVSPFVVTDDYVWDAGSGLPVVLQDTRTPRGGTAATTTYLYGLGLISETSGAGVASYYLADGLGSTTRLTDSTGTVTDTYSYDVFGAPRTTTGTTANNFQYTGQQRDGNANRGLYYLRARSYDPALGRFLQKDPLPLDNPYAYAENNAGNATEPSGLCWWKVCHNPARNLKFLGQFLTGTGATNPVYGPNSPEASDIRNSPGAQAVRDQYVATGCVGGESFSYGTIAAYFDTLINPTTLDPSSTAAQVGGFAGASVRNNANGTITITIQNDASAWSLLLHIPFVKNPTSGPFRTIHQTFQWKETRPAGC